MSAKDQAFLRGLMSTPFSRKKVLITSTLKPKGGNYEETIVLDLDQPMQPNQANSRPFHGGMIQKYFEGHRSPNRRQQIRVT